MSGANQSELTARPHCDCCLSENRDGASVAFLTVRSELLSSYDWAWGHRAESEGLYAAPEEFQVPANRVYFSSAFGIGLIER